MRLLILRILEWLAHSAYAKTEHRLEIDKMKLRAASDKVVRTIHEVKTARAIHERMVDRVSAAERRPK